MRGASWRRGNCNKNVLYENIFFLIKGQMQKEKYASVHFMLENYRHISWIKSNKESVGYLVIFPHSVLTCKYPVI